MKKEDRQEVYGKYFGRCAYCGKKIEYREMQVDHLQPRFLADKGYVSSEVIDSMDNLMPSCRRCNHYKRANSLETFRKYVSEIPKKLSNGYIGKVGLDYKLVEFHPRRVEFFFEKWQENGQVARPPVLRSTDSDSQNYDLESDYLCPTCGTVVGHKNYTDTIKLVNRCEECGRLIEW